MTTTKPNHIGRKIARIRELRGMKEEVAKVLGVTKEGIENFSEETVLNVISNTFNSNDSSTLNAINVQPSFNPVDKVVELYERLVEAEKEKVRYLEELLKKN